MAAIEEIETRLGYDALDIEFAVDTSGEVYVFQVRPIAIQPHIAPTSPPPVRWPKHCTVI